ncbi:unnamed protein product [Prunus brigantina]
MTVAMLALAAAQGQRQMGFLRTTCRAPNPLIQKGGGQSWDKLSIVESTACRFDQYDILHVIFEPCAVRMMKMHGHGSQGNPNNKEQFEASAMDTVFKAHKRAEGTALHRMEMQCDASVLA